MSLPVVGGYIATVKVQVGKFKAQFWEWFVFNGQDLRFDGCESFSR